MLALCYGCVSQLELNPILDKVALQENMKYHNSKDERTHGSCHIDINQRACTTSGKQNQLFCPVASKAVLLSEVRMIHDSLDYKDQI